MKLYNQLLVLFALLTIVSCNRITQTIQNGVQPLVQIRAENGSYQLYRNGVPYFIKGACVYDNFDLLKESGGNSIRVYNVNADSALKMLDRAHKAGLTVTLGLDVAPAEELDYSDEKAVQAQLEKIKKDVLKLKNHPALLLWGIGNELNRGISSKQLYRHYQLWSAVDDIAEMIHDLDPNHPTTTMIPFGDDGAKLTLLVGLVCNDLDIISINVFDDTSKFDVPLISRPYLVSEFSAYGYWEETNRTEWYAILEPTSYQKAQVLKPRYNRLINLSENKCLGSYVFIWDQKQECTSTWFSMFTQEDQPTELVDMMHEVWTNHKLQNKASSILSLQINSQEDVENVYVREDQKLEATITALDAGNENLKLVWELQKETAEIHFSSVVGQQKPEVLAKGEFSLTHRAVSSKNKKGSYKFNFNAPKYEGPYRLFVYLSNKHNRASTSNIPFYVLN